MDTNDGREQLHNRTAVVQEAIIDVVHDATCRHHLLRHRERLEAESHRCAEEVREQARRAHEHDS